MSILASALAIPAVLLTLAACEVNREVGAPGEAFAQEAEFDSPATVSLDVPTPIPEVGGDQTQPANARQSVEASRSTALVRAAERVAPAVVSVNVLREQQVRARTLWDDFFLGPSTSRRSTTYGSGIIFHEGGYILTNGHVIRGAQKILVTLPDGRDFEAELVGSDGTTDVAVLRVEGDHLPLAPLGTAEGLLIGEWTVAIGNPFSYLMSNPEPTVTAGVVSAVGRHIIPSNQDQGFYLGMIQTDASINPGNSGGPLVNALGEVIGVNTSIFSRSGGSEGLGFAIPIDRALRIAEDLISFGEIRRAWTGVEVEAVEADVWGRTRGVQVSAVFPGSPAAAVGLSEGDRLIRANGRALSTPLDLEAVLLDLMAGEEVEVEVQGRRRPFRFATETLPTTRAERVEILEDLEVITVTPEIDAEQGLGVEFGALVSGISQGLQQSMGFRRGDVIVQVNNQRILTAEDAAQAIRELQAGSQVMIRSIRNGGMMTNYFRIMR